MKKIYVFLILFFMLGINSIDAKTKSTRITTPNTNKTVDEVYNERIDGNGCIGRNNCILLCSYITSFKDTSSLSAGYAMTFIYYSYTKQKPFVNYYSSKNVTSYYSNFSSMKKEISYVPEVYENITSAYPSCPVMAEKTSKGIYFSNVGYSNNSVTNYDLTDSKKYDIFEDIKVQLNNMKFLDNDECKNVASLSSSEFSNYLENKLSLDFLNDKITLMNNNFNTSNSSFPKFLITFIQNQYKISAISYKKYIETCYNENHITEEEYKNAIDNKQIIDQAVEEKVKEVEEYKHADFIKEVDMSVCGLFGKKTFSYIKILWNIIRFGIPILIIIFGMLDFAKVVLSGEEKSMKEALNKFLKRVIAGIVVLLAPVLIQTIFNIVGFSDNCISNFIGL